MRIASGLRCDPKATGSAVAPSRRNRARMPDSRALTSDSGCTWITSELAIPIVYQNLYRFRDRRRPRSAAMRHCPVDNQRPRVARRACGTSMRIRSRRMLRAMTVEVTVKTVEPTATAVVAATAAWAEFPKMWGPMLDQARGFLRSGAAEGLSRQGHNCVLYKDDDPDVEVWVQVSGSGWPAGHCA